MPKNASSRLLLCLLSLSVLFATRGSFADILFATGSEIKKAASNGTGATTFINGGTYGLFYDSVAQKIYFTSSGNTIRRANRDGTDVTTIVSSACPTTGPVDVVVDRTNSKLAWTCLDDALIRQSNLDGSGATNLVVGTSFPHGLAIDTSNGKLYWAGNSIIERSNLDGSSVEVAVTDPDGGQLAFLFLNSGKIYWSNYDNSKIRRANTDGTTIELLAGGSNATNVEGISFDNALGKLFFLGHPSAGVGLSQGNLDGTGISNLSSDKGFDLITDFTIADPTPTPTATATPTATTVPSATTVPTIAPTVNPALTSGMYLAVTGGEAGIFWTDLSFSKVRVVDSSSAGAVSALTYSSKFKRLYWATTQGQGSVVRSSDKNGNDIRDLFTTAQKVVGMGTDNLFESLVFSTSDGSNGRVWVSDLRLNSTPTEIVNSLSSGIGNGLFVDHSQGVLLVVWPFSGGLKYVAQEEFNGAFSTPTQYLSGPPDGLQPTALGKAYPEDGNPSAVFCTAQHCYSGSISNSPYPLYAELTFKPSAAIVAVNARNNLVPPFHSRSQIFASTGASTYNVLGNYTIPVRFVGSSTVTAIEGSETDITGPSTVPPRATATPFPTSTRAIGGSLSYFDPVKPRPRIFPIFALPIEDTGALNAQEEELTTALPCGITSIDASGGYAISNLTDGDYNIFFDRADFTPAEEFLSGSPGDTLPTISLISKSLEHANCSVKDRTNLFQKSNSSALKLVKYALNQAIALKKKGNKLPAKKLVSLNSQLVRDTGKIKAAYCDLLENVRPLPEIVLSCKKSAACTAVNKRKELKASTKALAKIVGVSEKMIASAAKSLAGKSQVSTSPINTKLRALFEKATDASSVLPFASFTCD